MSNIVKQDLADLAYSSMAEYSSAVILERAIPDARDGLKPVQRRILWQSHLSKLRPESKHVKVIKLAGLVAGFHPHGDGSTQGAVVGLSQPWIKTVPLIDIHGNYGSIDGSPAAAGRYISARQSPIAPLLLNKIDHDAVDLMDNFDNTALEPKVLPASFPVAMTNGASGIAVAVSTKILPHNPVELLKATKAIVKQEIKEPKQLAEYIKGPDFPTGGIIVGKDANIDELETGAGRFSIRGKVQYNTDDSEPNLEITEIPYGITTTKLIEKMSDVLENARALGVIDIRDETIEDTEVSIKLVFKKNTSIDTMKKVESFLYKKTDLELTISSNNVMITRGRQRKMNMLHYLKQFADFRKETLVRIWNYDLNKLNDRLEILIGLLRAYDITTEIVKEARESEGRKDLSKRLVEKFKFTERQADTIAGMPIYQLGKQDFNKLTQEKEDNEARANEIRSWLATDESINEQLIIDLEHSIDLLKDYKRRTQIIDENEVEEVEEVKIEDVIEAKNVKVVVKSDLQIFQIGKRAFDNQIEDYKDDDIIASFDAVTTDYVTAISKNGLTVTRFINDLDHSTLEAGSESLHKQVKGLKSDDKFVGAIINEPDKQNEDNKVVIASKMGYIKVIEGHKILPSIKTKSYVKKTGLASTLKAEGDYLIFAFNPSKDDFDRQLQVTLKDNKKNKEVTRKINLDKWVDRKDGAGGSGFRGLNTKDGQLSYEQFEIVDIESN